MITLSRIAKLANVSVSTASKAFSMSNEVSEETRQVIFDIAKNMKPLRPQPIRWSTPPSSTRATVCTNATGIWWITAASASAI